MAAPNPTKVLVDHETKDGKLFLSRNTYYKAPGYFCWQREKKVIACIIRGKLQEGVLLPDSIMVVV